MEEVVVEFLTGFVDERGGVWVRGMHMNTTREFADLLVRDGMARIVQPVKTVKPAVKKELDK